MAAWEDLDCGAYSTCIRRKPSMDNVEYPKIPRAILGLIPICPTHGIAVKTETRICSSYSHRKQSTLSVL